jgi:hypothetical protein
MFPVSCELAWNGGCNEWSNDVRQSAWNAFLASLSADVVSNVNRLGRRKKPYQWETAEPQWIIALD